MATKSVSEPNVTDIIQRVRDYDMDAIVRCAEDDLRLAMEQTQLLVQLADACERLHGELNNCETCGGTGIMQVVVGVVAPTEEELYGPEPCGQCFGDGKSGYAQLSARVAELEHQAQLDAIAFSTVDHLLTEARGQRDVAESRVAELEGKIEKMRDNIDRGLAVETRGGTLDEWQKGALSTVKMVKRIFEEQFPTQPHKEHPRCNRPDEEIIAEVNCNEADCITCKTCGGKMFWNPIDDFYCENVGNDGKCKGAPTSRPATETPS